jgi:hypothetical protein
MEDDTNSESDKPDEDAEDVDRDNKVATDLAQL